MDHSEQKFLLARPERVYRFGLWITFARFSIPNFMKFTRLKIRIGLIWWGWDTVVVRGHRVTK